MPTNNKENRVSLIGFGNFGKLAASILSRHCQVQVHERHLDHEAKEQGGKIGLEFCSLREAAKNRIIILATPISETEGVIKELAGLIKEDTLVIDTCSVKILPCQWLKTHLPKKTQILGTHPMFGPTTSRFDFKKQEWSLDGLQIVLCPLRIPEEVYRSIKGFLTGLGISIIETTPKEHDKQNAKTLGLVHYIGRALNQAKIGHQEIYTPGYLDLLRITPHTNSDNWQLFYDMHNYNPYAKKIREDFKAATDFLDEKLEKSQAVSEMDFRRRMIDYFDRRIVADLARRFEQVLAIGKIKKRKGVAVIDKEREAEIIDNKVKLSKLSPGFIRKLYGVIFKESYRKQTEL